LRREPDENVTKRKEARGRKKFHQFSRYTLAEQLVLVTNELDDSVDARSSCLHDGFKRGALRGCTGSMYEDKTPVAVLKPVAFVRGTGLGMGGEEIQGVLVFCSRFKCAVRNALVDYLDDNFIGNWLSSGWEAGGRYIIICWKSRQTKCMARRLVV
jgi:hypothetical protein